MRSIVLTVMLVATSVAADEPEATVAAHARYQAGEEAFGAGHYAEAALAFEEADRLCHMPALSYDIGRARELAGDSAAALAAYERYLQESPQAENAGHVRAQIAALRTRLAPPAPEPAPAALALDRVLVETAPIVKPTRRPLRIAAWATAGAAAALAITGGALLGSAHASYGALTCAPACADSAWVGIRSREYAGVATLGLAGAAVVADIALWVIDARRRR